jgi:hypothetical protein
MKRLWPSTRMSSFGGIYWPCLNRWRAAHPDTCRRSQAYRMWSSTGGAYLDVPFFGGYG